MNKLFLLVLIFISGCTSITVKPLSASLEISNVCIKENPKVTIEEFLPVVREGFKERGLTTKVYKNEVPSECKTIMLYTARRSWDFVTYLSHAEIIIENENRKQLAKAIYHLKAKGGLMLTKWKGVESKMKPVIYELLSEYKKLH